MKQALIKLDSPKPAISPLLGVVDAARGFRSGMLVSLTLLKC
jgi:hypothetical protein